VERGGDRELVVALARVRDDRAGEVQDAVGVAAIALVADVVAARMLAVAGEDLLQQRMGAEQVDAHRRSLAERIASG
jgi:hypothetical protein